MENDPFDQSTDLEDQMAALYDRVSALVDKWTQELEAAERNETPTANQFLTLVT